jgi:carbamate kinase
MGAELKEIMDKGHRENPKIVVSPDPKKIVEEIISMVKKDKVEYKIIKASVSDSQ